MITQMNQKITLKSTFNEVNDIGVIWVMDEAAKQGFYNGNPEWANLGQGEPEVGEMEGAPPRLNHSALKVQRFIKENNEIIFNRC